MKITMSQLRQIVQEVINEVGSKKQRRWACAQMGKSRKNFKGDPKLSKAEAEEMCKADVKKK